MSITIIITTAVVAWCIYEILTRVRKDIARQREWENGGRERYEEDACQRSLERRRREGGPS
jgi:hypothetical protein